jgi:hypothetical protein
MSLSATVTVDLNEAIRKDITDRMSAAMGSYVQSLGKTDFAYWAPEEWQQFLDVAFDVCAPAIFLKRVIVVPPYDVEYPPPY